MSRYLKLSILLSLIFSIFSSPGMSQDFLTPSKDNDLDRQSKFIDAQSELIIGNTEGAIKIYDELLKKDVNDHEAAFFLGKTYFQEDDMANAIKYFSLALANEKENPWYYLWAADAFLKNEQFDQATGTIEQLVSRFPDEKSYYDRLEYLYRDSKQYQKQIELIDRMQDRFGFHKNDALAKARALDHSGQTAQAIELLDDLSGRFPKDLFILNMLANLYEQNDQKEQALATYNKILTINPNDSRANLAVVDANKEELADGSQRLLSLKSFFLNKNIEFDTQFSEIVSYLQDDISKLPADELEALDQVSTWLLTSHPDNPKALALRADILAQTGQNVEATDFYIQTIKLHPDNFMVWEQLLWSLKELHRWKDLNQYAENATMYFPNKAVIYLLKAEAGYHLEDYDEALFDLETCLTLALQDPVMQSNALGLKALIECANTNHPRKSATFEQARTVLDANPNIDLFESICMMRDNDLDNALTLIERALSKVPEKPSYRVQKAKILFQQGQFQESLQTLLDLEGKSTYFPIYEWIARSYEKLNQPENADKYSQLALKYGAPTQSQIKN